MTQLSKALGQDRSSVREQLAAFAGFIGLGLIAGAFGIAFPYMRSEFTLDVSAAGVALIANTLGYTGMSFISGSITRRLGYSRLFLLSLGLIVLGLVGYAVAPSWLAVILTAAVVGAGAGLFDAAMNAYYAAFHNARSMNWLHACFGIGTTLSPLIMTAAVNNATWRAGYLTIGLIILGLLGIYFVLRREWLTLDLPPASSVSSDGAPRPRRANVLSSLRSPWVWLSMLIFFVYAGLEAAPGTWAYSLFTERRSVDPEVAGWLVSLYWGSFTVGRIFFGAIITRWKDTIPLVRACIIATGIGAVMWWLNPTPIIGYVGLVLLGFGQAPLFPVLVTNTPRYVGKVNANDAIGFQIAGASLGVAVIPSLIGVLASLSSLDVVAPTIAACALIIFVLHEIVARRDPNG